MMHGYRCIGERGARNVSHAVHVTFVRVEQLLLMNEGLATGNGTSALISRDVTTGPRDVSCERLEP